MYPRVNVDPPPWPIHVQNTKQTVQANDFIQRSFFWISISVSVDETFNAVGKKDIDSSGPVCTWPRVICDYLDVSDIVATRAVLASTLHHRIIYLTVFIPLLFTRKFILRLTWISYAPSVPLLFASFPPASWRRNSVIFRYLYIWYSRLYCFILGVFK